MPQKLGHHCGQRPSTHGEDVIPEGLDHRLQSAFWIGVPPRPGPPGSAEREVEEVPTRSEVE